LEIQKFKKNWGEKKKNKELFLFLNNLKDLSWEQFLAILLPINLVPVPYLFGFFGRSFFL